MSGEQEPKLCIRCGEAIEPEYSEGDLCATCYWDVHTGSNGQLPGDEDEGSGDG